jgi:PhnB protein
MNLNPNLNFSGQCESAFRFYAECLGGKIVFMMTYGDSPMAEHVPLDWRGKIMHATLDLGEAKLMGADSPPDRYQKPQGFSLALHVDDVPEAERVFTALAEGGSVVMPLQETFWAKSFGMVTDRFGTPWMINCGKSG